MEPILTILASAKLVKTIRDFSKSESKKLGEEAGSKGFQSIIGRLQPSDREKAARKALQQFGEAWYAELEGTAKFTASLPGYHDQLAKLLDLAAPEIVEWMNPETKEVDLGPVERIWNNVKDPDTQLPEEFDWNQVARNYARAVKKQLREDPSLLGAYEAVLQERNAEAAERTAAAVERIAGPKRTLDVEAYRKFLIEKKCNTLQLATLHFSSYTVDRKVSLWSVFVPQSARESAPVLGLPPEIVRKMREEGHLAGDEEEGDVANSLERYASIPIRPILEILEPLRREKLHIVVTGDPGAGKSALFKYICLKWAQDLEGPMPILIDLKEYGKTRVGFLKFCESGRTMPRLEESEVEARLKDGVAAIFLDGLDEIFDPAVRHSVVEEITTLSAEYKTAQIIVSSRKVGYQPERLSGGGFTHATLEDFDDNQINQFIEQWHQIAEADDSQRAQLSSRLRRAIADNHPIRELAGNPLLLTMMSILNRSQELPQNRVSLYRKASEVLLHDWDANRALLADDSFDREDKEKLLRDLAGEMQQGEGGLAGNLIERRHLVKRFTESLEQLGIPNGRKNAQALVAQLEERNFILASVGAGRFSFVHRTFLEFFCAAWFAERTERKEGTTDYLSFEHLRDDVFGKHWHDEKWHEVLRLIAGMAHETKANELIQFLMAQDGTTHQYANLILAANCLYDVRNRKAIRSTDEKLWNLLVELATRQEKDENALGGYPSPGDIRPEIIRRITLTWRGEEAADWLKTTAYTGPTVVCQSACIEQFARTFSGDPATYLWLKERAWSDVSGNGSGRAVEELAFGWKDQPEIVNTLKDLALNARNEHARRAALEALGVDWSNDPAIHSFVFDRLSTDPDWYVRIGGFVAIAVSSARTPEMMDFAIERYREEQEETARSLLVTIAGALWRHGNGMIDFLKQVLATDPSKEVRKQARSTLKRIDPEDPETIALLETSETE